MNANVSVSKNGFNGVGYKLVALVVVLLVIMLVLEAKKAAAAEGNVDKNLVVNGVSDQTATTPSVSEESSGSFVELAVTPVFTFLDVEEGYWASDAIQAVAQLGLAKETKFRPHDAISGAGFVSWMKTAGIAPKKNLQWKNGQLLTKQDVIQLLGTTPVGKSTWYGLDFPGDPFHLAYFGGLECGDLSPTFESADVLTRSEAAFIIYLLTSTQPTSQLIS